ncbi:probable L-type lectin-domain containing receptor kinase S.5, partial [Vigna umbellata]|uniref:probable L-type lectin-domain containing receptor kinase S.5 n=1 Tax=Vigna umbellata TaxID=87088 RepID=UPI001F5EAE43
MQIPWIVKYQYAATLFFVTVALTKVTCFQFNFPSFPDDSNLLLLGRSRIFLDAIQVTLDNRNSIENYSGRALYSKPYQLWKQKNNQNQIASFNTTFVLRITPETSPGGEGLAFILTSDRTVPENSDGQWLGIVNATSNGTSQPGILAVEFDTRHSFTEDGPDNHVGININSINSIQQVSLMNNRLNLSSGQDVKFHIQYINDTISVFGAMSGTSEESMETLLVSPPLNLSSFLQKEVYIGFSASTSNYTERNCVRSWDFSGDDIRDDDKSLLWVVYV